MFDEPRTGPEIDHLVGSIQSSVNYSEVMARCLDRDMDAEFAEQQIARLHIETIPFSAADARLTAALRATTRHRGLSLGDRACLALALREGAPVLTADRQWQGLDIGIDIRLIR